MLPVEVFLRNLKAGRDPHRFVIAAACRCAKLSLPGPALPQALLAQSYKPHHLLLVVMIVDLRGATGGGLRLGLAGHCGTEVEPVALTRLARGIEQELTLSRPRFRLHGERKGVNKEQ